MQAKSTYLNLAKKRQREKGKGNDVRSVARRVLGCKREKGKVSRRARGGENARGEGHLRQTVEAAKHVVPRGEQKLPPCKDPDGASKKKKGNPVTRRNEAFRRTQVKPGQETFQEKGGLVPEN